MLVVMLRGLITSAILVGLVIIAWGLDPIGFTTGY